MNKSRSEKRDFASVLTRFALERLLYRISISAHADHFLLKGAMLFDLWFDVPMRPTRDIDLLGLGLADETYLIAAFTEICTLQVDDGIHFDEESIRAEEIRKEANYAGIRVCLLGWIDGARCQIQIDIGYGDAVSPGPDLVKYPVMLKEFPAPILKTYPRYTVVAEKFEALITLGIANSRMKDYFDLWVLAMHSDFEGVILREAISATLARRGTETPIETPFGLTETFATDTKKRMQWAGFLKKNQLEALALTQIVAVLRQFLMPPLTSIANDRDFSSHWRHGSWH
mgnify:CR=1 FL=1